LSISLDPLNSEAIWAPAAECSKSYDSDLLPKPLPIS